MEIPQGFDTAQRGTTEEALMGVTLTGQLANRAANSLDSTLGAIAGLVDAGKSIKRTGQKRKYEALTGITDEASQEVARRQAVALDTEVAVAAANAERVLNETTRDRPIEQSDVDQFQRSVEQATEGMDKPVGWQEASSQGLRKAIAEMGVKIAERNFNMLRDREIKGTAAKIITLTEAGNFDLARAQIEEAADKTTMFTPDQLQTMRDQVTVGEVHSKLIDIVQAGTPEAIEAGRAYANDVLNDKSLGTLRDSLHASLKALINRVDDDNVEAANAAAKQAVNAEKQLRADRMAFAAFGRLNGLTGETDYMTVPQLDQLAAAGVFAASPNDYVQLRKVIESRAKQAEADSQNVDIVREALALGGDPQAANNPALSKASTTVARNYADTDLPDFAEYNKWPEQSQRDLEAMVRSGFVPPQLHTLLLSSKSGASPDLFAAVEMSDNLRTQTPLFWNDLPAPQRNFYNTVLNRRDAGLSVTQAAEQYTALEKQTPEQRLALSDSYKTASGGTTRLATDQANTEWLTENLAEKGAALFGLPEGTQLADTLDDDPQMNAYVVGAFNGMVEDFYRQNGGSYDAALQTAFESLGSVVRPTGVNGYPELMLYSPEFRPHSNVPVDPAAVRAQWVAFRQGLEGYDEATNTARVGVGGEQAAMFRLVPTTGWADKQRVFMAVDANGAPARLKANGEVALWQVDYAPIEREEKRKNDLALAVQRAEENNKRSMVDRAAKELEKNPHYVPGFDIPVWAVEEAKNRKFRADSYRSPAEPFENQYPGMITRGINTLLSPDASR